jgi:hypothetical protein
MRLIAVLLHCPDCKDELELTMDKLHRRHRLVCPHCPGKLDLHPEVNKCLIWVGYRALFDVDLKVEPDGVIVCLRSDR